MPVDPLGGGEQEVPVRKDERARARARLGDDRDTLVGGPPERGGAVLGICGGYQMLGRRICDPDGIEGPPGEIEGLGLIEMDTVLTGEKLLRAVSGASWTGAPG